MKKIIAALAIITVSVYSVSADNFKILYLTTPDIAIGGKTHKVGDTFAGDEPVAWSAPRQAMKVLNMHRANAIKLKEEYESRFGPLSNPKGNGKHWEWVDDPWPWEYAANKEV